MSEQSPRDGRTGAMLVARALAQEMERDDAVCAFGEDVAAFGGVFGATRGLQRRFGGVRVFDTPISEAAFVGMALGAAQAGLRPIVEIMFADFIGVCFDQLLNGIAKNRYMSGGEVSLPLVVRTAGGSIGSGAQHSQVLGATLAHIPGLKVFLPGTPGDLQRMLVAAVRSDDPVIVIEHKWLLKSKVGDLPFGDAVAVGGAVEPAEIGQLRTLREGDDLTVIAAGWMVQEAMRAAVRLQEDGIHARVVDLRSLVPLDVEGIVRVAAESRRVLVVDEDFRDFGLTSEVLAVILEHAAGPVPLVARHAPRTSQPASIVLEREVVPDSRSIEAAARTLVARGA